MPSFKAMPDGTDVANILFTGALLILIALSFAIALVANSRHQMRSAKAAPQKGLRGGLYRSRPNLLNGLVDAQDGARARRGPT